MKTANRILLALSIAVIVVLLWACATSHPTPPAKPQAAGCSLRAIPLGYYVAGMSFTDTNGSVTSWTGYPNSLSLPTSPCIFKMSADIPYQCPTSSAPNVIMWEFRCKTNPPVYMFDVLDLNTYGFSRTPVTMDCTACSYSLGTKGNWPCGTNVQTSPKHLGEDAGPLTPLAEKVRKRDGTNYLGVYMGMIAEWDGWTNEFNFQGTKKPGPLYQGIMMFSAASGECLKWISYQDFFEIFVSKTRPEYPK